MPQVRNYLNMIEEPYVEPEGDIEELQDAYLEINPVKRNKSSQFSYKSSQPIAHYSQTHPLSGRHKASEQQEATPINKRDDSDTPNSRDRGFSFRKNSLKFCRRLSKSMLGLMSSTENQQSERIFTIFGKMIETQVSTQRIAITDRTKFSAVHKKIMTRIWTAYKNIFSNYKNNKICLVTFEEWQLVFSEKGFSKEFQACSKGGRDLASLISFRDLLDQELFINFYQKMLFIVNKALINLATFQELMHDEDFLQRASNIDDFSLMANYSWIYRHYNHSKGKFAVECCARCKICRSSSLPGDYYEKLSAARDKITNVKFQYALLPHLVSNDDEFEDQVMTIYSILLEDS